MQIDHVWILLFEFGYPSDTVPSSVENTERG
jgi:hypothetical protein